MVEGRDYWPISISEAFFSFPAGTGLRSSWACLASLNEPENPGTGRGNLVLMTHQEVPTRIWKSLAPRIFNGSSIPCVMLKEVGPPQWKYAHTIIKKYTVWWIHPPSSPYVYPCIGSLPVSNISCLKLNWPSKVVTAMAAKGYLLAATGNTNGGTWFPTIAPTS